MLFWSHMQQQYRKNKNNRVIQTSNWYTTIKTNEYYYKTKKSHIESFQHIMQALVFQLKVLWVVVIEQKRFNISRIHYFPHVWKT